MDVLSSRHTLKLYLARGTAQYSLSIHMDISFAHFFCKPTPLQQLPLVCPPACTSIWAFLVQANPHAPTISSWSFQSVHPYGHSFCKATHMQQLSPFGLPPQPVPTAWVPQCGTQASKKTAPMQHLSPVGRSSLPIHIDRSQTIFFASQPWNNYFQSVPPAFPIIVLFLFFRNQQSYIWSTVR